MDDSTYVLLQRLKLDEVRLVRIEALLDDEALRDVRAHRSPAEFCWTCTAPWVSYVMAQEPCQPLVTYLDADLFFYSDPKPVFAELTGRSILIHEHRFSPEYRAWEATSGIYNVGLVAFKNDAASRECLDWWRWACLEKCALDPAAGSCGDQKYLDDWPARFPGVAVLQHRGAGVAPWNIANYTLAHNGACITVDAEPLIFYHFHSLLQTNIRLLRRRIVVASRGYRYTRQQMSLIYRPYVRVLNQVLTSVHKVAPDFSGGLCSLGLRELVEYWLQGKIVAE